MAASPAQFQQAVDKIVSLAPLEELFVHGGDTTDVPTANGFVASMAKIERRAIEKVEVAVALNGTFTTIADGLAATAEGGYFMVQSSSADAFTERYQKVGGAAVYTGKSLPSTQAVRDNIITSGERFDTTRVVGQMFNGAAFVQADGKDVGFNLPAGQTGQSTFVTPLLYFSREESDALGGKRVRVEMVFNATPDMLADLPLTGTYSQVLAGGSYYNNLATLISRRQSGTQIIIEIEMVWDATYTALGPTYQLQGVAPAAKNYSLQLASVSYRVLDESGALSNADATLLSVHGRALNVLNTVKVMPMRPGVDTNQISEMFQGANRISENGRAVGISIPPGATGVGSYILEDLDLTRMPGIPLAGETMRFRVVMQTSAGFDRGMSIKGLTFYGDGDVPRELPLDQGMAYVDENGDTVQQGILTLIGDETHLRPYMIVANGGVVSGATQTIRIKSFDLAFIRDDPGLLAFEKNLSVQQRAAIARAERRSRLSFTDAMNEGFRGGIETNGAVFHRDANNRVDGWRIPANTSGAGTYVQTQAFTPEFEQDKRFAKRLIRLHHYFDVTAGYSREVRVTVQSMFNNLTQNRLVGVSQSTQTLVTPTILLVEGVFIIQGDEEELRPFFIQQSSAVATSEQVLSLRSFGYTFEDAPGDPSALGGAALTTLMRDMRLAAKVKNNGTVGSIKAYGTFQPQFFQGATQLEVGGKKVDGWRIPANSTAQPTLLQYKFDWGTTPNFPLAGRVVQFKFVTRPSVPYSRSFDVQVQWFRPTGATAASVPIAKEESIEGGTLRVIYVNATLDGTESGIGPYLQAAYQTAPSGQVETLEVLDVEMAIISSPLGEGSLKAENEALAMRYSLHKASQTSAGGLTVLRDIYKDPGTGLMPSLVDLMSDLTDASASRRYEVVHHGGKQRASDNSFYLRHMVDMRGIDKATAVLDAGVMPANVGLVDMQYDQSIYMNGTSRLYNLTILGKNCRYPIHSDSGGQFKDFVQVIEDCYIEHLGNDEARAWQAANGGNPNAVWSSEHAWGCGNSSGSVVHFINTELRSPTSPLYWHTNGMFERPSIVKADNCRIICTKSPFTGPGAYSAIYVQPLGSFQQDQGLFNNNLIAGDVVYDPLPWIATNDLAHQRANHAEVVLSGGGNSGVHPFRHVDRLERALRITSTNTTNASAVEISGSAVPILFGDGTLGPAFYSKPGAGGIRGYVYGWNDVGNGSRGYPTMDMSVRLGTRLGNCTASPKVLNVKINGGATVTHTFNQDYTNLGNSDILAQLNATLGSAAVADTFNPTMLYRPSWTDQEMAMMNSTTVGILMGSVVAHHESGFGVRLMTSADDRSLYAGVAWEDIYPGKIGRVKTGGHLFLFDVLHEDQGMTVAVGDSLSVDPANAGKVVKGGNQGLLKCVRANVVKVGAA